MQYKNKNDFKKDLKRLLSNYKNYSDICHRLWRGKRSLREEELEGLLLQEKRVREKTNKAFGEMEKYIIRLGAERFMVNPLLPGYKYSVFDEALSHPIFNNPNKRDCLDRAIQSLVKVIGKVESLSEVEFKDILIGPKKPTSPLISITTRAFSFIKDKKLKEIIERDYSEIVKGFATDCYKSVIILCGGSLEALLLYRLRENEQAAKKSNKAPKEEDIEKWDLNYLIDVATDIKIIENPAIKKLSHSVREYRNLVHPGRELRSRLKVEPEEAKIAFEVLNILIREFKKDYKE